MSTKHALGQVITTAAVYDWAQKDSIRLDCLVRVLDRHRCGDWGDICPEDKQTNENALLYGNRILSVYRIDGTTIWIITEADRSATTILFPEDY